MKYLPILFLALLTSCQFSVMDPMNQEIAYHPTTFYNAWFWVSYNVVYKHDSFGGHKQLPSETYRLRTGDCEDYALLLMYFAECLDEPALFIGVKDSITGDNHVIIYHNGEYKEPQVYYKSYGPTLPPQYTVIMTMTYTEAYYSNQIRSIL